MGLGVVGGGVALALLDPPSSLARKLNCPLSLKKVLIRDAARRRTLSVPPGLVTTDASEILADPEINLVVEVIGGEEPAVHYIKEALTRGKHVVTANKEVMAKHGTELIRLAASKGVHLLFEASVGGGIPIVGPLTQDLLANDIRSIHAIINGTTNYILTRMDRDRIDFADALKEAQEKGYAEADPANDIDGTDAAYKLAILATLAFHFRIDADDVYREGISRLRSRDFRYAHELGYAIKLLAIAGREGETIWVRVHPCLIPEDHMLAKVDGVYNAVEVEGDPMGRVLFHGLGAGREPTTSAVMGDVVEIARKLGCGSRPGSPPRLSCSLSIGTMAGLESRFYLRLNVADRAGVLAQIGAVLGEHNISIASVIQKDTDPMTQSAEIVVTTHPAREDAMQRSLKHMEGLDVVRQVDNLVRIEEWPDH